MERLQRLAQGHLNVHANRVRGQRGKLKRRLPEGGRRDGEEPLGLVRQEGVRYVDAEHQRRLRRGSGGKSSWAAW